MKRSESQQVFVVKLLGFVSLNPAYIALELSGVSRLRRRPSPPDYNLGGRL